MLAQLIRGYIKEQYAWEWVRNALANAVSNIS